MSGRSATKAAPVATLQAVALSLGRTGLEVRF
jgi:hypothetical protein